MGKQHEALFAAKLAGSSGGGGTSDYDELNNRPQINGTTLTGNKSGSDLGLVDAEQGKGLSTEDFTTAEKTKLGNLSNDYDDLTDKPQINGVTLVGNESAADLGLLPASTRYGAYLSTNAYISSGSKYFSITLQDKNGNTMSTSSVPQPVVNIDCNSSGLSVKYMSTQESVDISPAMSGKVDKVQGKGLSTNDFTNAYKNGLTVMMKNPLNHNAIFRGKDLTNVYTVEEMYDMIHAGTFDDLYIGDCFTKSITTDIMTRFTGETFESGVDYYEMGGGDDPTARTWTLTTDTSPQDGKTYATKSTVTENIDLMFAGFDMYYNMGNTSLTDHHALLIPRTYFSTTAKMNDTNTTVGGYFNSDMHQITLPCYAKSLKTALGGHLLSHKTRLSNAINASTPSMAGAGLTGASSGSAWVSTELQLMTEQQVYGTNVCTSSFYDIGIDYEKLPVFNFITPIHYGRGGAWLSTVASATTFGFYYYVGLAYYGNASSANCVRPIIVFG